jgi:hypothetical protein
MMKREVVWLLVRIAGVYLLVLAFRETLDLIGMFVAADTPNFIVNRFGLYIGKFLRVAFLIILGQYLLRDGRFLFRLLYHEPNTEGQV